MNLSIRLMTEADFEQADNILRAAFGTPDGRIADLRRYNVLQPDGWFIAEADGKPAGTVGAVIFDSFAYLGSMAVAPTMQRRGIARALMQHILAWLDSRGCTVALLDASQSGAPLYTSMGFVAEGQALVFQRDSQTRLESLPPQVSRMCSEDISLLSEFDAPMYGAARAALFRLFLADFGDRAFVTHDDDGCLTGFLFAQRRRIGPWIARNARDAEALLQSALTLAFDGAASFIVPSPNTGASEFLERYGFRYLRSQLHMWRGLSYPARQRAMIYGQASFGVG